MAAGRSWQITGIWGLETGQGSARPAQGVLELLEEDVLLGFLAQLPGTWEKHRKRFLAGNGPVIIMCDLGGFITPIRALVLLNPPSDTGLW